MRRSLLALTAALATLSACSSGTPKAAPPAVSKSPAAVRSTQLAIPAATGTLLLALSGRGRQTTKAFTVSKPWSVNWNYDCDDSSGLTNFQIYPTSSDPNVIVNTINALSARGHGRTGYAPTGRFYLIVNTSCAWSVRVAQ